MGRLSKAKVLLFVGALSISLVFGANIFAKTIYIRGYSDFIQQINILKNPNPYSGQDIVLQLLGTIHFGFDIPIDVPINKIYAKSLTILGRNMQGINAADFDNVRLDFKNPKIPITLKYLLFTPCSGTSVTCQNNHSKFTVTGCFFRPSSSDSLSDSRAIAYTSDDSSFSNQSFTLANCHFDNFHLSDTNPGIVRIKMKHNNPYAKFNVCVAGCTFYDDGDRYTGHGLLDIENEYPGSDQIFSPVIAIKNCRFGSIEDPIHTSAIELEFKTSDVTSPIKGDLGLVKITGCHFEYCTSDGGTIYLDTTDFNAANAPFITKNYFLNDKKLPGGYCSLFDWYSKECYLSHPFINQSQFISNNTVQGDDTPYLYEKEFSGCPKI